MTGQSADRYAKRQCPTPGHCLFSSPKLVISGTIITCLAPPYSLYSLSQHVSGTFILPPSASLLPVIHSPAKVSRPLSISSS